MYLNASLGREHALGAVVGGLEVDALLRHLGQLQQGNHLHNMNDINYMDGMIDIDSSFFLLHFAMYANTNVNELQIKQTK